MHHQSSLPLSISEEDRLCAGCGEPLVRREGEYLSQFKKRKTCGRECQSAAHAAMFERRRQAMLQSGERECTVCKQVKPLSQFNRHQKALYRADCKECQSAHFKAWRSPRATDLNKRSRKWYRENRERVLVYNVDYRKRVISTTTRECLRCGRTFRPTSVERRYCSTECARTTVVELRRERGEWGSPLVMKCQECGATITDSPSRKGRRKYCSRECASPSRMRTIAKKVGSTSIESSVYAALESAGVDFHRQHVIGIWAVDAYIPSLNLVIECQGDYWHCNPKVFPDGPESDVQRRGVERDRRRRRWFTARGYQYIELWESDINDVGAEALVTAAIEKAS